MQADCTACNGTNAMPLAHTDSSPFACTSQPKHTRYTNKQQLIYTYTQQLHAEPHIQALRTVTAMLSCQGM